MSTHDFSDTILLSRKKGQRFVQGNTFDGILIQLNKTCQVMVLTRKFVSIVVLFKRIGHGRKVRKRYLTYDTFLVLL